MSLQMVYKEQGQEIKGEELIRSGEWKVDSGRRGVNEGSQLLWIC